MANNFQIYKFSVSKSQKTLLLGFENTVQNVPSLLHDQNDKTDNPLKFSGNL